MKYLLAILALTLTSCATTGECPRSDQSEQCQCYRRELPRAYCYDNTNRFDR